MTHASNHACASVKTARARRGRGLSSAAALAVATAIAPSWAQSPYDQMAAEQLFQNCLRKMQASTAKTDCSCFEESQRIFPQPGTLFTLANCEEKAGNVATSAAYYEGYLKLFEAMSPQQQEQQRQKGQRDVFATEKLKELAAVMPQLVITLAVGAPKETIVSLDGRVLQPASVGVPVRVDPGAHVVTAKAPGKSLSEARVTIQKAEQKVVRLNVDASGLTAEETAASTDANATSSGWRTYLPIGLGSAGLLVGTFFLGAHTVSEDSDATKPGMAVGFGAVAGGLLLLLILAPTDAPASPAKARATSVRPQLTFGPAGATLGARAVW